MQPTLDQPAPAASNAGASDLLRHLTDHGKDLQALLAEVHANGGLTEAAYVRFLSNQVHFTRGVQRHFFAIAGHEDVARRRPLRDFLVRFAIEEEPHWQVALADLRALGRTPMDPPVEVDLWWAFFDRAVAQRPFVRLGATALLENLGAAMPASHTGVLDQPFLRTDTTRFYELHRHQDHPHGEQVMQALEQCKPSPQEWADLARGAEVARKLHLGALRWALTGTADARTCA